MNKLLQTLQDSIDQYNIGNESALGVLLASKNVMEEYKLHDEEEIKMEDITNVLSRLSCRFSFDCEEYKTYSQKSVNVFCKYIMHSLADYLDEELEYVYY